MTLCGLKINTIGVALTLPIRYTLVRRKKEMTEEQRVIDLVIEGKVNEAMELTMSLPKASQYAILAVAEFTLEVLKDMPRIPKK